MHPDDLSGEQLRQAAALADGAVDVDSFDPVALFVRVARIMERMDDKFRIYIKTGRTSGGQTEYIAGIGDCPFEACMRALIKSRGSL